MAKATPKKEMKDDLRNANALEALARSEGGAILLDGLLSDIVSSVETIVGTFGEATHVQLISSCARLKEKLDLYRAIMVSAKNRDIIQKAYDLVLLQDPDEL